ncbi:MAG: hypothetical protein ABIR53_06520 [Paraperlucidibaca sp.]
MTRLLLLVISLALLSACTTRERYEARINTYVGKPISVVMDDWGYPSGSFDAPNGNTVYTWDKQSSYTSAPSVQTGVFTGTGSGGGGFFTGFGFGSNTVTRRCQTYFEVDKQKVILRWRTQGNDCRE